MSPYGHFRDHVPLFYGPYHNEMLTKVYNNTTKQPSLVLRIRNPLILNELRAHFQRRFPTKSTPFSIILAS